MRTLWIIITAIFLFNSCGKKEVKQFKFAGGSIKMAIDNEPSTYNSMEVSDYFSASVVSQIMEGLVAIDPKSLQIIPQIASSWKISDDGLKYEFLIRSDVLFHANPMFVSQSDRILKPKDVKYTFEYICSKKHNGRVLHAYNYLFKDLLEGAEAFMEGKASSISGVELNGQKIILTLVKKDENFLNKLANICAAIHSEKILKNNVNELIVGTGPFQFESFSSGPPKSVILVKNKDYYLKDKEGNQLPYLDKLEFFFENRKQTQLAMFEKHLTDIILGLPTDKIAKMLEGRIKDFNSTPPLLIMYNNTLLATQFYYFDMTDTRFKDVRVRQAFNYALNRDKIGQNILRNQFSELGYFGITPPIYSVFKGYDFNRIKEVCYAYDPVKAQKLLAEAGYPNGKGFGTVMLRFNIDEKHSSVAQEFAQQIGQNLGINVNIDGSTFEQKEEDGARGNGDIFRSAWNGDYVSPESFLSIFYGKNIPSDSKAPSYINKSRYHNPLFDHFFENAKNSNRMPEALENYGKAERILMQDPPIIPLWYMGDIQLVYSNVRNLNFNVLNIFSFKKVYKKDWTLEEYTKATK